MKTRHIIPVLTVVMAAVPVAGRAAVDARSPIVLELFTSQSCSSCPPADALLQKLAAANPDLIALSYHVDYWDRLDWKDSFSSPESTARQKLYEQSLGQDNVYTPELVVDGVTGIVGSREGEAEELIARARSQPKPVRVTIEPGRDGSGLVASFGPSQANHAAGLSVWLVTFSPRAVTAIHGGENSGRELTSINNVSSISRLGNIAHDKPSVLSFSKTDGADTRIAVLVQESSTGHIVGAAMY